MGRVEDQTGSLRKLGVYFNNKMFSDVVIETEDGSQFHCHKVVLAAASPVFKAMFAQHGGADVTSFKEGRDGKVTVKELDTAAVEWLLSAMYTGEGVLTTDLVVPVMMVARMYQVDWVHNACGHFLNKNLNVDTCCVVFDKLVHARGANRGLKGKFAQFIHDNIASVSTTESFLRLSDDAIEHLATLHTTFDFCVALARWVEHDFDSRKDKGRSLSSDVDFFSLRVNELQDLSERGYLVDFVQLAIQQTIDVLTQCTSASTDDKYKRLSLQRRR